MSLRSVGVLARQRRAAPQVPGSAASGAGGRVGSLEEAIPIEVITLYTAIIAACESVLSQDPHNTFFAFRLLVYLVALACTVCVAIRTVTPATNSVRTAASSPEVLAATLAFGAWGLALPGSFLYVWLDHAVLSITVVTVTAAATFLLAVFFAPRLRTTEMPKTRAQPPLTQTPPAGPPLAGQNPAGPSLASPSATKPATTGPPQTGPPLTGQSVSASMKQHSQQKFPAGDPRPRSS